MDINTVCTLLINALKGAGYNESQCLTPERRNKDS